VTAVLLAGNMVCACGGTQLRVAALDEMERVRASQAAREGASLAPEAYARAEQQRDIALQAHARGDDVAATLHAERAVAAYDHGLVVARLAHAASELADAQKSLEDGIARRQSLEASRTGLERNADELEQRAQVERQRMLPAPSGTAPWDRESARLVAARSLTMQARLLCDAARLAGADGDGFAKADDEVGKLEGRVAKNAHPAPIDDAMRSRALCLELLTHQRRASSDEAGAADALLSELSASGGWDPSRDERGVVVTLRDAFRGSELTAEAAGKLKELGRVAAAHAGFGVQVVLHDAVAPPPKDAAGAKRADAAAPASIRATRRCAAETSGWTWCSWAGERTKLRALWQAWCSTRPWRLTDFADCGDLLS